MSEWISVKDRLPEEKPTMFAKLKGTDRWKETMPENMSDKVIVTVVYENGERRTETAHTADGVWKTEYKVWSPKVVAWQPLPEPYKEEA